MNTATKLVGLAALATTIAVVAAGCSSSPGAPVATTAPPNSVDLRMTVWTSNEDQVALFDSIAEEYQADHPEIKSITFESLPFADYNTTLTTQIAGGNSPDLAWMGDLSKDLIASDALVPLTDTLSATEGWDYDDLLGSVTAEFTADDQLYAYPFSTSPFAMFVNNDLIRKAGAKTPEELIAAGQWTWANAITSAEAVAKSGKAGLIVRDFNYQDWQYLASVWNGWGASPWSADGKRCTLADKPMVDAMSFLHDAIFVKKAMPGPGQNLDFFAGDAAMTITQISRASLLPKDKPFAWDLVPLPKGPAGDYALIGQAGIGVFSAGKNAAEAASFVAFMSNPENSAKLAQFFPSARKSLLNADVLKKTNALLSAAQIDKVVVSGIATGKVMPGHSGFARIQQTVRAGLDTVWTPQANIPAAMQSICAQITPLLQN